MTPEQAKILELLEYRLATFKLVLKARWTKGEGFEKIDGVENETEDAEMSGDDD